MSSQAIADHSVAVSLSPVARTLLVPLWARAEESRRARPVMVDPKAAAIVRALDVDLSALEAARASQLGCCVRGALVDQWVRDFLRAHPDGTVIELGVGLNSRQERLDNGRARWIELDLSEVMSLRERFFAAHPRRVALSGSLTERDCIEALRDAVRGPCMAVSEGVLVYLREHEVRTLMTRLRAALPGSLLVIDTMTRPVIQLQGAHDAMRHFEARFTWGVGDPREVEGYAPGLRIERSESFYELLYAHPGRLPRWMRVAGPPLAALWPGVRWCYAMHQLRLGS